MCAVSHGEYIKNLIVVDSAPMIRMDIRNWLSGVLRSLERIDLHKVHRLDDANEQMRQSIKSWTLRQFLLQNLKRQVNGSYAWRCNLPEVYRFIMEDHPGRTGD